RARGEATPTPSSRRKAVSTHVLGSPAESTESLEREPFLPRRFPGWLDLYLDRVGTDQRGRRGQVKEMPIRRPQAHRTPPGHGRRRLHRRKIGDVEEPGTSDHIVAKAGEFDSRT